MQEEKCGGFGGRKPDGAPVAGEMSAPYGGEQRWAGGTMSGSFSRSAASVPGEEDSAAYSSNRGGGMRPLPAYTPAPSGRVQQQPLAPQASDAASLAMGGRAYRTRERLYYESEAASGGAAVLGAFHHQPQGGAAAGGRGRLAHYEDAGAEGGAASIVTLRTIEDAPPVLSHHEFGGLTPERRYALSTSLPDGARGPAGQGPAGSANPFASPMGIFSPGRAMDIDHGSALGQQGVFGGGGAPQEEGQQGTAAPVLPDNKVTVFGFVGSQAAAVLAYFRKLGAVEESALGDGNWMHLRYATRWAAQKALAKNGTILPISGACMVGVVPTQSATEQVARAADSFMSPLRRRNDESVTDDGSSDSAIFIRPNQVNPIVGTGEALGGGQAAAAAPSMRHVPPSIFSHRADRQSTLLEGASGPAVAAAHHGEEAAPPTAAPQGRRRPSITAEREAAAAPGGVWMRTQEGPAEQAPHALVTRALGLLFGW